MGTLGTTTDYGVAGQQKFEFAVVEKSLRGCCDCSSVIEFAVVKEALRCCRDCNELLFGTRTLGATTGCGNAGQQNLEFAVEEPLRRRYDCSSGCCCTQRFGFLDTAVKEPWRRTLRDCNIIYD